MSHSIQLTASIDNVLPMMNASPHYHTQHSLSGCSDQNIQTVRMSQDCSDCHRRNQSTSRKYRSLDVQQIFPNDLYTNLDNQHSVNSVSSVKADDKETSIDSIGNGLPTMNLIETANYVQSRRRTRKLELIFSKKSNHMNNSSTVVDQPKTDEQCLNKKSEITIFNSNYQDKSETNNKTPNPFGTCTTDVNDQNVSTIFVNDKIQIVNKSNVEQTNLSSCSLSTSNADSIKTNDLSSIDQSTNSSVKTTTPTASATTIRTPPYVPVKWRRAKLEKNNLHCNTDAKIITIRRRLENTGVNTWNTKSHTTTTLNKLEHNRSNNLTLNTNMKFINPSINYITPIKQKSRLTISKETFTQSHDTYEFNNNSTTTNTTNTTTITTATMNQCNDVAIQQKPYDFTELNENELRSHLKKINEELLLEQSRRNHLASICADLMEENRKLRDGQSNKMIQQQHEQQQEQQIVTTDHTTLTSLLPDQSTGSMYKNYKNKKVKLNFINGKIKQISSNSSIWKKSKVKSHICNHESDICK
ncbi:unnamed protein product [Schistosoma turkestanicum]|nr:unnamed protein product [Schistosoma turkestanicum]